MSYFQHSGCNDHVTQGSRWSPWAEVFRAFGTPYGSSNVFLNEIILNCGLYTLEFILYSLETIK